MKILSMEMPYFDDFSYYYDYESYDDYYHSYGGVTCMFDYIEIKDGGTEQSPLIDAYCGNNTVVSLPIKIQSSQNNVWIK